MKLSKSKNQDKLLGRHCFSFNKNDNGGEQLILTTEFFANGDEDGVYTNQEISLESYSNSASISLFGASITPTNLRELANQLESEMLKAKLKTHD